MSTSKSILVVEDEADLANVLTYHLKREGYDCRLAGDGQEALTETQRRLPDVVVLDRMLPKVSGDDVAMRLKSDPRSASVPIIMLTAKAEETDELVGFALGADDYIRKPFSIKLLLARIAAVLRRREATNEPSEVLTGGPITLDRGRHDVTVDGESVALTATEFRLLGALMSARGRVLSREQLIDSVLGFGVAVTHRTIDVHVAALRKKLAAGAGWIQTVRGVGYAFRAPTAELTED
ncbi:MAG: response regulator transcription factor [Phycisphaerae bacterium]|jgi:two-component system phosphate regulon response regulator PhoB